MCVRNKFVHGCGHKFRQDVPCHDEDCHKTDRFLWEEEGDCKTCRRGGETVSRGRDGQGKYARELSRRDPHNGTPNRVALSSLSINTEQGPWSPSDGPEKPWKSPVRVRADRAWELEHDQRCLDLENRSRISIGGSRAGSVRSNSHSHSHSHSQSYEDKQQERDDYEHSIREELQNIQKLDDRRERRRRDRHGSYDSFDSYDDSRGYSHHDHDHDYDYDDGRGRGSGSRHSHSHSHSHGHGHSSPRRYWSSSGAGSGSHRPVYDSGFASSPRGLSHLSSASNVYNNNNNHESYLSGWGHAAWSSGRRLAGY